MAAGSRSDGTEDNRDRFEERISKIFRKKLKFVTNVTHVTMKDAIVYPERIGDNQCVPYVLSHMSTNYP